MTGAHLHLILNHVPPIGTIIGLAFLVCGFLLGRNILIKSAMWLFFIMALTTVPTFLTGDPAEHVAEHMPGTSVEAIHEHEEAADKALIASIVMGVISLTGLILFLRKKYIPVVYKSLILIVALITAGLMTYTANLGGKVRRPELRGEEISLSCPVRDALMAQAYNSCFKSETTNLCLPIRE